MRLTKTNRVQAGKGFWLALLACLVSALAALPVAQARPTPVTGGTYTSVNSGTDGSGTCLNGSGVINCNIYTSKQYVWLNGGPGANSLSPPNGDFMFAVLEPGGQPNPNDCSTFFTSHCSGGKNLSDDYDCWQNRAFRLTNGEVSQYPSPAFARPSGCFPPPVNSFYHWLDDGTGLGRGAPNEQPPFIRLFPYANTTNPGGVYIMAICSLATHQPPNLVPSDCKYDAFKVPTADQTPPACQLTSIITGPPKQIQVTVQDVDSGLESVTYTVSNGTVSPDSGPFTINADGSISGSADLFVGIVTPFVLTVTKTNQALGSRVSFTVNDVAGMRTVCDPVIPGTATLHPLPAFANMMLLLERI